MERAPHQSRQTGASVDLRELLDAIPHIAWATGLDGEPTYLNAQWQEYTGVDCLDRAAIADALHPEDLPKVHKAMETAHAEGRRNDYDVRIRSKENEYRWHRVKALPLRNADGSIKCWIGTTTDVHEEYVAAEKLRESEAEFRFFVDSNPQVPWTTDANGQLLDCSDRWLQITGLSKEEALTTGWTEVPHPDDLPRMIEALSKAMKSKTALDIEHRARMADGTYRWMRSQAHPRMDESGNVIKWYGSTEDIHERRAAQEALRVINEQLEEAVAARTRELQEANQQLTIAYRNAEAFSYTTSHDLRAPLRGIIANASILLSDYGATIPQEAKELLEDQATAARRMAALIDDLLAYSRVGKTGVNREPLNLSTVAEAVARSIGGNGRFQIEPDLFTCADPSLVPMILQNLFENATTYSPDGTPVRFGASQGAFVVSDEGMGFSMEYAERIFEPFERLHRYSEYPGTGIGLATARKIVEMHGGRIWAESEPGQGARFYFTLEG